jgi:glycosyltransferase involved in cell wall biosynthesis
LLKRQILYVSNTQNIHDARFIKMLKVTYDVTQVRVATSGKFFRHESSKKQFDLAIVAGLDYLLPQELFSVNFPIIGISLGYDINLAIEESSKAEIVRVNIKSMIGIILDSDYSVKQLGRILAKPLSNYLISPYGADIENFESHSIIINQPLSIVVTRSWSGLHANIDIVKAMSLMKNFASIHFLGVTETDSKAFLEDLVRAEFHKVQWYRSVPQSDVPLFLQKGWCYVSASRSDGTSISLLEAMAAGKICVVSDFPSNLEWVSDGVNGFLFKNGDPSSLASVLDDVSQMNVEDLHQIAQNARESVNTRGRWTVNSEKIMGFIGNFLRVG